MKLGDVLKVYDCIMDLKNHIENDYDEYKYIFKKYKRIMHKEIKENPDNMIALSLLAMLKL